MSLSWLETFKCLNQCHYPAMPGFRLLNGQDCTALHCVLLDLSSKHSKCLFCYCKGLKCVSLILTHHHSALSLCRNRCRIGIVIISDMPWHTRTHTWMLNPDFVLHYCLWTSRQHSICALAAGLKTSSFYIYRKLIILQMFFSACPSPSACLINQAILLGPLKILEY